LPKVAADSKNKLVQMGSGNTNGISSSSSSSNNCDNLSEPEPTPAIYEPVEIDRESFVEMMDRAKSSKNYEEPQKLYLEMFKSPVAVCATFKVDPVQDGARKVALGFVQMTAIELKQGGTIMVFLRNIWHDDNYLHQLGRFFFREKNTSFCWTCLSHWNGASCVCISKRDSYFCPIYVLGVDLFF
jgi:hypothetical protein